LIYSRFTTIDVLKLRNQLGKDPDGFAAIHVSLSSAPLPLKTTRASADFRLEIASYILEMIFPSAIRYKSIIKRLLF
tara:strand:+ start:576 stop:806 length:231 start_codon:yes stop_codon:yes gene_type:complete